MKFVIQRVTRAEVTVAQETVGAIKKGFLVLIGVNNTDTEAIADKMLHKLLNLRIFEDENGKTNLSLKEVNGGLLLVSQFTLYADCRKGNRPSFIRAARPEQAIPLYELFKEELADLLEGRVQSGEFGADMQVSLVNDGPVTIFMDSRSRE